MSAAQKTQYILSWILDTKLRSSFMIFNGTENVGRDLWYQELSIVNP